MARQAAAFEQIPEREREFRLIATAPGASAVVLVCSFGFYVLSILFCIVSGLQRWVR